MNIRLEGKKTRQGNTFENVGVTVTGDCKTEAEVQRRILVGAHVWRREHGVMADRKISRKLKGKVLMLCVIPAGLCGLETVALTERQQRLQVCENHWVRRIAGVKRVDRRRMDKLSEDIGVQISLIGRLAKCRLRCLDTWCEWTKRE